MSDNQELLENIDMFLSIAEAESKEGEHESPLKMAYKRVIKPSYKDVEAAARMGKAKGKEFYQKHKIGVKTGAGIVGAATLIAAGIHVYDRVFSSAAKKCSGYAGSEKTECMKRVKAGATDSEINELKKSMTLCAQSSDPLTCKKRLKDRIGKLSEQLTQLRDGSLLRD